MRTTTTERHERHVSTDAPDVEVYRTPKGNGPMRPRRVHVTYNLTGETGPSVEVIGDRLEDTTRPGNMTRRVRGSEIKEAPEWLQKIVREFAPGHPCRERSSR